MAIKRSHFVKNSSLFLIGLILNVIPVFSFDKKVISSEKLNQAENLLKQGEFKSAIKIYRKIIPNLEPSEKGIAYYNLAVALSLLGLITDATKDLKKGIPLLQKYSLDKYIIANLFLSQLYLDLGFWHEAKPIIEEMLALASQKNLPSFIARTREIMGNFNLKYGNYSQAIKEYKTSLEIALKATTLNSLAIGYYKRAKVNKINLKSTDNLTQKANLKKIIEQDSSQGLKTILSGIKASQNPIDKISSRLTLLKYYNSSLTNEQFNKYKQEALEFINNLPNSFFKASNLIEFAKLSKSKEALKLLYQASKIAEKIDDRYNQSLALENKGNIYLNLNKLEKAKINTEPAIALAQEINNPQRLFYQQWQLGKIFLALANKNNAIEAYSLALSDLNSQRGELGLGSDLLFHLQDDAILFLREYIQILLELEQIERVIEILPILKLSEFQNYFNDPCLDLSISKPRDNETKSDNKTATLHYFISSERVYTILEYQNQYSLKSTQIDRDKLSEQIYKYRKDYVVAQIGNYYIEPSKELYKILIEPIEEIIPESVKFLLISRDSDLKNIPYESLMYGNNKYLIEKYSLIYIPGLPTINETKQEKNQVIFSLTDTTIGEPLQYAEKELSAISSAIEIKSFLGNNFTANQLEKTLSQERISLLHLATHGSFSGTAKNSYLQAYDRLISLEEFKSLLIGSKQPVNLLVLSGCQTAVGSDRAILGFAGMSLRARIPNIVGSLWSIEDDDGLVNFMSDFYQKLAEGKSIEVAKREAQLKRIRTGDNPGSWAGIILIQNR